MEEQTLKTELSLQLEGKGALSMYPDSLANIWYTYGGERTQCVSLDVIRGQGWESRPSPAVEELCVKLRSCGLLEPENIQKFSNFSENHDALTP